MEIRARGWISVGKIGVGNVKIIRKCVERKIRNMPREARAEEGEKG